MDESEFRRLLDLFPVVRSRDFVADSQSSRQSPSNAEQKELEEWQDAWQEQKEQNDTEVEIQGLNQHDVFWKKLKSAAEKKIGPAEAERFCKSFQGIHNKLVYEELGSDAAQNLLKLSLNSGE